MTDVFSKKKRSEIMSNIKNRDTGIELVVRKYLFSNGLRYRKNDPRYPGSPDIVLPKYKTVVFVNGCFWHGHENCKLFSMPKSQKAYWIKKISRNRERDKENIAKLEKMGWRVITVWECELKPDPHERLESLYKEIIGQCTER